MLTELQTKKWSKLFAAYDANHDGVISQSDFEQVFRNLATLKHLDRNPTLYRQGLIDYIEDWEFLYRDLNKDPDSEVTLPEWLEYADQQLSNAPIEQVSARFSDQLFGILDINENGVIGLHEYQMILAGWQVPKDVAETTFVRLDLNADQELSRDEFVTLMAEFLGSDDPESPGNGLLGPL
jgi:Ca2+-binding EF-hand superfamily protein